MCGVYVHPSDFEDDADLDWEQDRKVYRITMMEERPRSRPYDQERYDEKRRRYASLYGRAMNDALMDDMMHPAPDPAAITPEMVAELARLMRYIRGEPQDDS